MFDFEIDNSSYFDFTTKDKKDFVIKQNSELPLLELYPIRTKNFDELMELMKTAVVTFNMYDQDGCIKILNKPIDINLDTTNNYYNSKDDTCRQFDDFTLQYRFSKAETKKAGFFKGEFKIVFKKDDEEKTLIVPINNILNILITPSSTK